MYTYLCGKNLEIYMWLLSIDLQACHEWLVNSLDGFDTCIDLCLYIFPHFLFFCFIAQQMSNLEKRKWAAKTIAHTSIWLGKRESDLYWNEWFPKSQRPILNIEMSKISGTDLKMRCIVKKWSNVMICKEAKWKALKICNHFLVEGHICSFL